MIRAAFLLLAAVFSLASHAGDEESKSSLRTTPSEAEAACQAQLREYRRSIECFAPYRTVNGGVRPEAFRHCKEVKQPRGCNYTATSAPPTRYLEPATPR